MQPDAALASAITAASSPDWSARARAARELARRAERSDVAELLLALLLDAHDTAVTDVTCHALLERNDLDSVRLIARALATADDEQLDHIYSAVAERHLRAGGLDAEFEQLCLELSQDPDPMIKAAAQRVIAWTRT